MKQNRLNWIARPDGFLRRNAHACVIDPGTPTAAAISDSRGEMGVYRCRRAQAA